MFKFTVMKQLLHHAERKNESQYLLLILLWTLWLLLHLNLLPEFLLTILISPMFSPSGGLQFCLDEHFQILWKRFQILWLLEPTRIYHCTPMMVNWMFCFLLESPQMKWVQLCLFWLHNNAGCTKYVVTICFQTQRYFVLRLHHLCYCAGFSLRHTSITSSFLCPTSALNHTVTGENISHTWP